MSHRSRCISMAISALRDARTAADPSCTAELTRIIEKLEPQKQYPQSILNRIARRGLNLFWRLMLSDLRIGETWRMEIIMELIVMDMKAIAEDESEVEKVKNNVSSLLKLSIHFMAGELRYEARQAMGAIRVVQRTSSDQALASVMTLWLLRELVTILKKELVYESTV